MRQSRAAFSLGLAGRGGQSREVVTCASSGWWCSRRQQNKSVRSTKSQLRSLSSFSNGSSLKGDQAGGRWVGLGEKNS